MHDDRPRSAVDDPQRRLALLRTYSAESLSSAQNPVARSALRNISATMQACIFISMHVSWIRSLQAGSRSISDSCAACWPPFYRPLLEAVRTPVSCSTSIMQNGVSSQYDVAARTQHAAVRCMTAFRSGFRAHVLHSTARQGRHACRSRRLHASLQHRRHGVRVRRSQAKEQVVLFVYVVAPSPRRQIAIACLYCSIRQTHARHRPPVCRSPRQHCSLGTCSQAGSRQLQRWASHQHCLPQRQHLQRPPCR